MSKVLMYATTDVGLKYSICDAMYLLHHIIPSGATIYFSKDCS